MTINEIESEDGAKLREDGKCADNNKEKYLHYLPLFETVEYTIHGAGVGVVAKENVPAGTQVGIYVGKVKSKADFINNGAGPYAIGIGNGQVLDAAGTSSSESLAHLCNTAFGTAQKNNARFKIWHKGGGEVRVRVVTTTPIKKGEEVLVPYGRGHIAYIEYLRTMVPPPPSPPAEKEESSSEDYS